MRAVWFVVLALMLTCAAQAQEIRDQSWFLRKLVDLDGLPILEAGARCVQSSSYDRASRLDAATGKYIGWEANGDAGHYMGVDAARGEAVMADIKGPGVIYRIWSANPQSRLRIYLDGAEQPSYEWDFNELFTGKVEPFRMPLVWQRRVVLGGGNPASDCWLPIAFARSVRVAAVMVKNAEGKLVPPGQYYHVQYRTFAPGTPVKTFRLPLSAEETRLLAEVGDRLAKSGTDPQPSAGLATRSAETTVAPGGEVELTSIDGPATIHALRASLIGGEKWASRLVLLRAYWDDDPKPAVEAPVEALFGEGFVGGLKFAERPYTSLPLGHLDGKWYSYFRMPFAKRARWTAINLGTQPAKLAWDLAWRPGALPADTARFHARFRVEQPSTVFEYPFLECQGRGTYVGMALFTDNAHGGWWGEGDERAYVDGEAFPSVFGTGSEDFFGDAWGIVWFNNPYHGSTDPHDRKQSCWRYQITENIPFEQKLRMTIENYTFGDKVKNSYASTAYWYAMPGGTDFFETPKAADLVPWGRIVQGAVEAETLTVAAHQGADPIVAASDALSGSKGVRQAAAAAGESFDLRGDLGRQGDSLLAVGIERGPDHGQFKVSLNGQPLEPAIDGYAAAPGVAEVSLGEVVLKGDDVLQFTSAGKAGAATGFTVGIDYVLLKPVRFKNVVEGESLKVLEAVGSETAIQGLGDRFSGDTQLWFPNRKQDSYFTVEVPVKAAGRYELNLYLCTAADYGICQVELDGKVLGKFDAYHEGVAPSGKQTFGVQDLTEGKHKLTLRAVDKNPKSTGYMIGLDCVQLLPQ
ncbi:MAG: DUF2961 domain-containing protein [Armatimonadetes bacterium]|nr:DUF2961 domain-containing protein [Armatimonadota bacterium]